MRVAIIGAGLAGTACAYVLRQHGLEPAIYEAQDQIAHGASGNEVGLYNPRLSAERSFFEGAFRDALRVFPTLKGAGWRKCGSLHLITNDKRKIRFENCLKNWQWPEENMRLLNKHEASQVAGIPLEHAALYLPDAGIVSPKRLCQRYADEIELHLRSPVHALSEIKADYIVVANGMGAKNFSETRHYPLKSVRGQVTYLVPTDLSKRMKTNLCYGGYVTPSMNGFHAVGATFQRWLDHSDTLPEDDRDNLSKMTASVPGLHGNYSVIAQRAGVRCTTDTHTPIIERVSGTDNVYVSLAHGSHGILTSLMAAYLIADDIVRRS